jgi:PX domain
MMGWPSIHPFSLISCSCDSCAIMSNRQGLTAGRDDAASSATAEDALAETSMSAAGAHAVHHPAQFFYLPKKLWSPRYESDFYSVTITGHQVFEAPPPSEAASSSDPASSSSTANPPFDISSGASRHHPALYYQVTVHRARKASVVWRRYSQFVWLKRQWTKSPPSVSVDDANPEHQSASPSFLSSPFPSPCPFFWWLLPEPHREAFLKQRQDELAEYLDRTLGSPGYPSHPATIAFLELRHQ